MFHFFRYLGPMKYIIAMVKSTLITNDDNTTKLDPDQDFTLAPVKRVAYNHRRDAQLRKIHADKRNDLYLKNLREFN
jgi:hypothetical protein